jgi:hypothetical protein
MKKGRPPGAKNIKREPAVIMFTEILKSFPTDVIMISPSERIKAAVTLAGYLLTPKANRNEN